MSGNPNDKELLVQVLAELQALRDEVRAAQARRPKRAKEVQVIEVSETDRAAAKAAARRLGFVVKVGRS